MSQTVHVPGGRRVVGTLDTPDADAAVVACPPHPEYGGSRSDRRLRAVGTALAPDVACLRFDYGPWDEGPGERVDAENALAWARDRFDQVALFGYSFGGAVALCAGVETAPTAVSALAPPAALGHLDAVDAVDGLDCPVQVVCGDRDETVDCQPVAAAARDRGHTVATVPADHHFVGQTDAVADRVAGFLRSVCR